MIKPLAFIAALALAGCGTKPNECQIFSPIRGSKADTAETRQQVDVHNAKGVGACSWKP